MVKFIFQNNYFHLFKSRTFSSNQQVLLRPIFSHSPMYVTVPFSVKGLITHRFEVILYTKEFLMRDLSLVEPIEGSKTSFVCRVLFVCFSHPLASSLCACFAFHELLCDQFVSFSSRTFQQPVDIFSPVYYPYIPEVPRTLRMPEREHRAPD